MCLPVTRVIRTLERIAAWRGYPTKLRLDNGLEFVALALAEWTERKSDAPRFSGCASPSFPGRMYGGKRVWVQSALPERVHRRSACAGRRMTEGWRCRYNHQRPYRTRRALARRVRHGVVASWRHQRPLLPDDSENEGASRSSQLMGGHDQSKIGT